VVDATGSIDSDFEQRRALEAVLRAGPLSRPVLNALLGRSASIQSDFEQAGLLTSIARSTRLDPMVRPAFFTALEGVRSAFERRRVLDVVVSQKPDRDVAMSVLDAAKGIDSDFERASALVTLARNSSIDGSLRDAYLETARTIRSRFEQDRAIAALSGESRR
jgi:hypothetical protein